ncbi:Phenol hydroxylase P5 protein [Streptomyces sp. YIM 121038]|uniref:globin domain-containing protein n=1 Tax=Streptomyces sp. YIM 121038 TaxID=2136401 RepID=UPI00111096A8|nr:globin domain-containing protein [Streptomyces sp. YIM 121038]QCX81898.1 Phenol hydroxylase P5 protein [Streptomyces sp. YIM 121038]
MQTDPTDQFEEYRVLLARQEAKRLRQSLLDPAPTGAGSPGAGTGGDRHDGAEDHRLITESLPLVIPFDRLISELYAAMFDQHPYLRRLFPESLDFQRAHLEQAFRYLIDHLDRPDEVTAFCRRLGRDHRKLGVRPVHYEVFETALVEALRRRGGSWWRQDAEEAWKRMLRRAVAAMVRGAEAALAERPFWHATVTGHRQCRPDLAVLRVSPTEPFPYRAGQYALLQSPLLARAWRPFSVACAPRPDGELQFHVRRTGPGGVSDALVNRTRVGDSLLVGPAQGTMTLRDGDLRHDVLIAASGTGWAGARALLQDLARRRLPGRTARLFLGARTRDELYAAAAAADLESRHPWLSTVTVVGAAAEGDALADAIARCPAFSRGPVFVSGPPALATTVRRLSALGLPANRIRHDLTASAPQGPGV